MTGSHRILVDIDEYGIRKGSVVYVHEKVVDSIPGYRCEFHGREEGVVRLRYGWIATHELCPDQYERQKT